MSKSTGEENPARNDSADSCAAEAACLPPSPVEGAVAEPSTLPLVDAASEAAGRSAPLIQGYEILEELGRGGMGVVYKAHQISLNRVVALKMVLAGAHASPEELARFRREAEAAAQLQHPNIVQVYEIGEQNGCPYFSLEFVDGGSLTQRLHRTPQPARSSAQLVETLARAVHAAHQHGTIHRDLKPDNVLLTSDGVVKITDFGLAKRLEAEAGQTKTGTILGTPSYMAPEQAGGKHRGVGPRADIYALGAILYELLTGSPPFGEQSPLDTLLQVLEREPARPRSLNPAVPRDLETICLKAMAKEPHQRYASAHELAEDLARFLNDRPILARPAGGLERFWRWCRRNRGLAGVSAMAAMLLGTVAVLLTARTEPRPRPPPDFSLQRVQGAGKLTVGTDPTYPPMEFRRDGALAGFDIDLARHVAGRLGVQAQFVAVDWDWQNLVKRLNAHEFDLLCSGVTVTQERLQQVDFVEYEQLPTVFVCKQGMVVRNEQDLAGKVVAVHSDTTAHQIVVGLKRKGIDIKQILLCAGAVEPFEAVRKGQAEITLAHQPVAHYYAGRDPGLAVMGPVAPSLASDRMGIAFCQQDKELQRAVTEALRGLKQDGASAKLRESWFGH
jgi:ABC-type amino acid transport substrate-binding protein